MMIIICANLSNKGYPDKLMKAIKVNLRREYACFEGNWDIAKLSQQ